MEITKSKLYFEEMAEMPSPPDNFNEKMSALWLNFGNELISKSLLTSIDLPLFARFCMLSYSFELNEYLLYESNVNAQELYKVLSISKQLDSVGSKLGLDPISRGKINIPVKAKLNPFSQKISESRLKKVV